VISSPIAPDAAAGFLSAAASVAGPMMGDLQGANVASNLEDRLTASKYKRNPTALL
jgi:hypothetical protein